MAFLRKHRSLGSTPLAVVTAADPSPEDRSLMDRLRPAWVQLQADLATLSTTSVHLTAARGGHFVYVDDPDTVIDALTQVINIATNDPEPAQPAVQRAEP
jgi:hypothetical protein